MLTFFTITATDTTAILGRAGELVSDLMPLLVIIFGIAIGIWVVSAIFHLKG